MPPDQAPDGASAPRDPAREARVAAAVKAARRAALPPDVLAEIAAGRVEQEPPPRRPQNEWVVKAASQAGLPPSVVTEIAAGRLKMVTS
jgi:hypothetical protein